MGIQAQYLSFKKKNLVEKWKIPTINCDEKLSKISWF
jgi:hypothetical protein